MVNERTRCLTAITVYTAITSFILLFFSMFLDGSTLFFSLTANVCLSVYLLLSLCICLIPLVRYCFFLFRKTWIHWTLILFLFFSYPRDDASTLTDHAFHARPARHLCHFTYSLVSFFRVQSLHSTFVLVDPFVCVHHCLFFLEAK